MAIGEYRKHIFVCFGKRCAQKGSEAIHGEFKERMKNGRLQWGASFENRLSKALQGDRGIKGEHSPGVIIYPDGVWYARVELDDIDEIVEKHIKDDSSVVERLCYLKMTGE